MINGEYVETENQRRVAVRHPDFDVRWAKYKWVIHWWACKLARKFGGGDREYLGILTLRFNRCLWYWKPEICAFSTYFSRGIISDVCFQRRKDSELTKAKSSRRKRRIWIQPANSDDDFEKLGWREERRTSWAWDLIDEFPDADSFWNSVLRCLNPRQRFVVEKRFRHGRTLKDIGEMLNITRARTEQISRAALDRVRREFQRQQKFDDLFDHAFLERPGQKLTYNISSGKKASA